MRPTHTLIYMYVHLCMHYTNKYFLVMICQTDNNFLKANMDKCHINYYYYCAIIYLLVTSLFCEAEIKICLSMYIVYYLKACLPS